MGWYISNVKNEVVINAEIANELLALDIAEDTWDTFDNAMSYNVGYKSKDDGMCRLYFNLDHMEHMDFVSDEQVQQVLKRHKAKGDICFASNDGDNAGKMWGYRFDGEGGMVKLVGAIEWVFKEVKSKKGTRKASRKK